MTRLHGPPARLIRSLDDLKTLDFVDGVAEVDVPIELVDQLPLIGEERPDTERLRRLVEIIRRDGYGGGPRIVIQLDHAGNWSIIDGGHRVTAARQVAREFWPNLFGRKVTTLQFVLYAPT